MTLNCLAANNFQQNNRRRCIALVSFVVRNDNTDGNQIGHSDSWFVDLAEWLEFYNSLFFMNNTKHRQRLSSISSDREDDLNEHFSRTNSTCRRWVVNGLSGQRAAVYRLTCDLAYILHSTSVSCADAYDDVDNVSSRKTPDSSDSKQNNVPLDLWTYCLNEFQRLIENHADSILLVRHIPPQVCAAQRMLSKALVLDANDAGLTHSLRQACRQIFEWLQQKFWLDEFQRILYMSAATKQKLDTNWFGQRPALRARHSICAPSSIQNSRSPFVFAEEKLFCSSVNTHCDRGQSC